MSVDLSVYLVTDAGIAARAGHDIVEVVRVAARNGVTTVQIREKDASPEAFLATVRRVSEAIAPGVTLLINDRVDVFLAAREAGVRVDGVHVGQSDLPATAVRALIGPDAILGVTASTPAELAAAAAQSADYVGIGALHETSTKQDAPRPLGHAAFAHLVAQSTVAAVAIGGVTARDLPRLRAAGVAGAAVVSAICAASDPAAAARELRAAWEAAA